MENKFKLIALSFALSASIIISNIGSNAEANTKVIDKSAKTSEIKVKNVDSTQYETVDSIDLVANPKNYINKKIKISALFDKFSTIGLDYEPVKKSSKDNISFIIKRPNLTNKDYTIPFSELKLIIKRDKAEKLIDIESGNKIEITGTVFSTALNDPWVDVDEVKILEPKVDSVKKNNVK